MSNKVFAPVLGKRIRVTELDQCGNYPESGSEDTVIVTDGFISVNLSAEVEDGTEIIQRNASGALCVNERLSNSFKRFNVEITFCGVNPELMARVTNAEVYLDYEENSAGFTIGEGDIDKKFALELWTGLSGQACLPGQEEASGYLLLPFVNSGTPGDLTIDGENAVTFSMSGAYTEGGSPWGTGPFEVVAGEGGDPAVLPTPLDPGDHLLLIDTGVAPPPHSDDPIAMVEYAPAG